MNISDLISALATSHTLSIEEYEMLITGRSEKYAKLLAEQADWQRKQIYENKVYIRGLIEISNICKNDCLYCGIRRSNSCCERYRLTPDHILGCIHEGYSSGCRTFVLQGGEDPALTAEWICALIRKIKAAYPDCAVTLSVGERDSKTYQQWYAAGADRYLLRHETADRSHYGKLHPAELSYDNRIHCLYELQKIGFQVGCGFMVGAPYQTAAMIAQDLKFIELFKPDMCGIGPFIPHKDTPFKNEKAGTVALTCYLLSIIRLIHPSVLLPATTALETADPYGTEKGILCGANVIMPNISPDLVRHKYELYNNKAHTGFKAEKGKKTLQDRMHAIGYEIVIDRGDIRKIM